MLVAARGETWTSGFVLNKISYYLLLSVFCALIGGCSDSECSVGERICEGNVSRTCYNGRWRDVECVKSKPICDETYGCVSVPSVCGNGTVEPEEECDGANLGGKTCDDVFAGLVGELRCSDKCKIDASSCMVPGCSAGAVMCVDGVLKTCEAGAWRETPCGDDACNVVRGACVKRECTGDARRCVGSVAQLCIDDSYIDVMDCAATGLVCVEATGLCARGVCTEGQRTCRGTVMQLCVGNAFVDVFDCATKGQVCHASDGTCGD